MIESFSFFSKITNSSLSTKWALKCLESLKVKNIFSECKSQTKENLHLFWSRTAIDEEV